MKLLTSAIDAESLCIRLSRIKPTLRAHLVQIANQFQWELMRHLVQIANQFQWELMRHLVQTANQFQRELLRINPECVPFAHGRALCDLPGVGLVCPHCGGVDPNSDG